MVKKKTQEIFIKEVKKKYGNKYDLSKIVYKNNKAKVVIVCKKHGEFQKRADSFLNGSECQMCFYEMKSKIHRKDKEKFISEIQEMFGNNYDYTQINYQNANTPIKIICPEHGECLKTPKTILQNKMICYKCKYMDNRKFIMEANEVHDNFYTYDKVEYIWCHKKIIITCPKHGDFLQEPRTHLSGHGCPVCKMSYGERFLIKYFKQHEIPFKTQQRIEWDGVCVFDFYLPTYDLFLEFDGNIHFKNTFYSTFENIHKRDKRKDEYICSQNKKLFRLHYQDLESINLDILTTCTYGISYSRHDYYAEATAGVKSMLPASSEISEQHIQIAGNPLEL
jgi:very-short-patch-repair endonuclease